MTNLFGNIATISTAPAFHPTVGMDPQGNVQALWVRTVGTNTIIEAAFQPTGGAFGPVEQISENGFVSDVPNVAAEQNGGASAVWTRFDGSTAVVQTSARRELNYPRPGGGTRTGCRWCLSSSHARPRTARTAHRWPTLPARRPSSSPRC